MEVYCPICSGRNTAQLLPTFQGRCVTSQMFFCNDLIINNRYCKDCGFIFNAAGTRGIESTLYTPENWKPKPPVLSFGAKTVSLQERALQNFSQMVPFAPSGSLLDFGAGTGAFLRAFHQAYPAWELTAMEPGGGISSLENLPLKNIFNGSYKELDTDERFDAIVVMSVLEHVSDVLDALRWIRKRLKPLGVLYMQHPNFEAMPGDLLCADHVNKLTPAHTAALCDHIGLSALQVRRSGSMFEMVCRTSEAQPLKADVEGNIHMAKTCEHAAVKTIEAVNNAVNSARDTGGKAAIFGASPIGVMSAIMLACQEKIACFVDENPNNWGLEQEGIPIVGPDMMADLGITDIALAISPVYWEQVAKKLSQYSVTVHIPILN